jgi:polysaccharide chain length determinant protein (PEP-CTERM system associated)
MDDYLAMLRRRLKVILLPALLAPFVGYLASFAFAPRYTSQSLVLVEEQKVPEGYVKPVITADVMQRIATIEQKVLSRNQLQPMVERLNLVKRGRTADDVIEQVQQNLAIEPLVSDMTAAATASSKKKRQPGQSANQVPGFSVSYTADNPNDAREICSQLTAMMLTANLNLRQEVSQDTTKFLQGQLDQAQHELDGQDRKLADFKKQYLGQLPGDEDSNLKILTSLNSQLEANTQTLNRAQQDRAYAESVVAQQVAAWKATQTSTDPQTLQKQLAALESQLITLQARYTDDHPDVVKTKNDIAKLKRKLNEINTATPQNSDVSDKASATEPPEVRQLRLQIHQYDEVIAQATHDQKRLQGQINTFQGRVAISPEVEEKYKQLTRDYDTAQKFYNDLLAKKSESEEQTDMEQQQQGEQMRLVTPATLPDEPAFPNRWLLAGGGLGAGLALGFGVAMWLELRDKSIRTEQDVLAVLDLPMLACVPWVGTEAAQKNGGGHWYGRKVTDEEKKETAEV